MRWTNRAGISLWMLIIVIGVTSCQGSAPTPTATAAPTQPTTVTQPATATRLPTVSATLAATPLRPATTTPAATALARPDTSGMLRQTRAIWSWVGTTAKSRADVDQLVSEVDAAHLNVILFLVYRSGTAYFQPSKTRFPDANERLTSQTKFVDSVYPDALSYLLSIRDQRRADADPTNDFEVQAWVAVNQGGAADTSTWPPQSKLQPYMLNSIFPEFVVKSGKYYRYNDTSYVSPQASAVEEPRFRQYMVDLITGLAEDYPVDGINLDYMREGALCFNNEVLTYSDPRFNFPGCQADYQQFTLKTYGQAYTLWDDTDGDRGIRDRGSGRVAAWQVHTVSLLVQAIHDSVKAARPNDIITVSSVRNVPSQTPVDGQTAWAWLDQGWIDAVFPTLYLDTTQEIVERAGQLRQAVKDSSKRNLVFIGLATHNFDNPNSEDWTPRVLERVNALLPGAADGQVPAEVGQGVALFRSEHFTPATMAALAAGPFREPALPYWGTTPTGPASH